MRQYIESVHCNGEVKEKIWKILDYIPLQNVILYAKKRNGRKNARNPKTGETKNIPPHYVAAFKAGRELKNSLLVLDAMNS